ncbi:uncharacterized protein Dana_GF27623, partial [Drosophila ananassae]
RRSEDNDNDNDDDEEDEEDPKSKPKYRHTAKGRTIHRLADLCSGRLIDEIDDECFYVGLGHDGHSAKRGNNYVPNDYKPFQCCPTKLEKSTKVPKMTAQRIGHSDGEQGKRSQGGNFQFASASSSSSAAKSTTSTKPVVSKKQAKRSQDNDDEDDDDDDEDKPLVKVSYANKRGGSNKPQAGKKPLNKVQDNDDEVEVKQKSSKKSGKLNVKTGINFFQNRLKNLYDLVFQDISLWE